PALKRAVPVSAARAPAIAGQFGPELSPGKMRSALQALGFTDVYEVAVGADLCTIEEAKDFACEVMGMPSDEATQAMDEAGPDVTEFTDGKTLGLDPQEGSIEAANQKNSTQEKKVTDKKKLPFMATSCCPAWWMMAKKLCPQYADCISMALTPMVLTGRLIKRQHPSCKVAFIGPCAAKKLEAGRRTIRSDVDFVLTFEELMGMFEAKEVDFSKLEVLALPPEAR
ncbi:MAG: hypothetical protein LUF30_08130, partial [Lachnospiraceae bacterium]|nr:hypothetical protein [Lachnospiraceae bacterium]